MSDAIKFPDWLIYPHGRSESSHTPSSNEILHDVEQARQSHEHERIARRIAREEAHRAIVRARAKRPRQPAPPPSLSGLGDDYDRILRKPEVMHLTGLSNTTIYRMVHDGTFPAPHKLSPVPGSRNVGWSARAVLTWIRARIEADFDCEDRRTHRTR